MFLQDKNKESNVSPSKFSHPLYCVTTIVVLIISCFFFPPLFCFLLSLQHTRQKVDKFHVLSFNSILTFQKRNTMFTLLLTAEIITVAVLPWTKSYTRKSFVPILLGRPIAYHKQATELSDGTSLNKILTDYDASVTMGSAESPKRWFI